MRKNNEALFRAVKAGKVDEAARLLDVKADINATDILQKTPLIQAVYKGKIPVVEMLLARNPKLEATDNHGQTALWWAAHQGELDAVRALLTANAEPNAINKAEQTPLTIAKEKGHTDIADLLVKHGAKEPILVTAPAHEDALAEHHAVLRKIADGIDALQTGQQQLERNQRNAEKRFEVLTHKVDGVQTETAKLSTAVKTGFTEVKKELTAIAQQQKRDATAMLEKLKQQQQMQNILLDQHRAMLVELEKTRAATEGIPWQTILNKVNAVQQAQQAQEKQTQYMAGCLEDTLLAVKDGRAEILQKQDELQGLMGEGILDHRQSMQELMAKIEKRVGPHTTQLEQLVMNQFPAILEKQLQHEHELESAFKLSQEALKKQQELLLQQKDRDEKTQTLLQKIANTLQQDQKLRQPEQAHLRDMQKTLDKMQENYQQTFHRQQFIADQLSGLIASTTTAQGQLQNLDQKMEQVLAHVQQQAQYIQNFDAFFAAAKGISSEVKREVSAEKTATTPRFTDAKLQRFYTKLKTLLEEFLSIAQSVAAGQADPNQKTTQVVASGVQQLISLIPLPYVSLIGQLLSAGIMAADKHLKVGDAKKAGAEQFLEKDDNAAAGQTVIEQAAHQLTINYQRQILKLTNNGIDAAADCARKRIMGYLISRDMRDVALQNATNADKVRILVQGVIEGNPSNLINTDLETDLSTRNSEWPNLENWTAEGLFKRTGLELLSDCSRYVSTRIRAFGRKCSFYSRVDKYGFRYGTQPEIDRYHFVLYTPAAKADSTMAAGTAQLLALQAVICNAGASNNSTVNSVVPISAAPILAH